MKIEFLWNGIKVDGRLYRAHYSKGVLINDYEESITVYAKGYLTGLPQIGLRVQNDSNGMTDYFETDRIRIRKESKFWKDANAAWLKAEIHYRKLHEKRAAKYGFTLNAAHPEVAAAMVTR